MAKKPKSIEHLDASIGRWKTRLKRAMTAIDKLEKQKKRLVKAAANPPQPKPVKPEPADQNMVKVTSVPTGNPDRVKLIMEPVKAAEIDTSIPAFLQRKKLDPVAAEIKAEQDEIKRKKTQGRIAKMKAKKSGETKKMPLTGRAALEAIRNG
ncbi:hypothetical protein KIP88_02560 [Bradyrhizobium sp. SRL28]|uniref:hypothetical protein n=1 Tax=Bradyrhizobium sp. SRL28 TaxID=2836178 RepID=UPI001BDE2B12|nr:hypothetical protein [Bradyrhizobium sp. SRL28]MBT1509372.1 hypothetical protein [Bradyrhizobium sp. SRL28]